MNSVKIGKDMISNDGPCWSIAEIGINHNGSMDLAHEMIEVAAAIGCDAVKFQKRTIEAVYSDAELATPRKTRFGLTNGDLKHGLEFDVRQYAELGRHAIGLGMAWGASVWDVFSVADLVARCAARPSFLKIASPTLTQEEVLFACAAAKSRDKIPVILSTGMSTIEEVRAAVGILGTENLVLMHCVSAYPPEATDLNLNVMSSLLAEFGCPVGYSGHENGIDASVIAAARGAACIERHFTLSKELWGSDQKISLDPSEFKEMLEAIWKMEAMLGSHEKCLMECELTAKKKLRKE